MAAKNVFRHLLIFTAILAVGASISATALAAPDEKPEKETPVPDVFIYMENERDNPEYAIVVETKKQRLHLYQYNGKVHEIFDFPCSTGKSPGRKTKSGDRKTPEGVYFFITHHLKRDLAPIYGNRAYPTDYPDILDRTEKRTGSAIWLHGTNKPLKSNDSNGCIVLDNQNIDRLTEYITLHRTPIIIVEEITYDLADKERIKNGIMNLIDRWNESIENGTYQDYVMAYDPGYVPDISWWRNWYPNRKQLNDTDGKVDSRMREKAIFSYDGHYVVWLNHELSLMKKTAPVGVMKLFVAENEGKFRIIAQDYLKISDNIKKDKKINPINLASLQLTPPPEYKEALARRVHDWAKAWSSMNIKRYGKHYSKKFRSQGMNRQQWLAYKNRLNRKYDYIRVTIDKLKIKKDKDKMIVTFDQHYNSSHFNAVGKKRLDMIQENGNWVIFRETWKKK